MLSPNAVTRIKGVVDPKLDSFMFEQSPALAPHVVHDGGQNGNGAGKTIDEGEEVIGPKLDSFMCEQSPALAPHVVHDVGQN